MIDKEFKSRVITSFLLLVILTFFLVYIYFLPVLLFVIIFLIFNEFYTMFCKIFKKSNILIFFSLLIILIYLIFFSVCILNFILTNDFINKLKFLYILSICIATDIGGYSFGKIFKGKKITSISPKKTYSGMAGSFFLSLSFSYIFILISDLEIKNLIIIPLILSLISQIGDLLVSYLKRNAKIKNTGSLLPGHGGLLDRLDGMLFTLPIGIYLMSL